MGDCLAPAAWLSPWPASSRAGAPAREAAASYLYLYLYLYLGRHSAFGCVRVRSVSVSVRSDAFGIVLVLAHGRAQSPHYQH